MRPKIYLNDQHTGGEGKLELELGKGVRLRGYAVRVANMGMPIHLNFWYDICGARGTKPKTHAVLYRRESNHEKK